LKLPRLGPTPYGLGIFLLALAGSVPFLPLFVQTLVISLLIYAALAYSLNIITGLTGYVSFGHVVFMGAGAYSFAYGVGTIRFHPLGGVALGAAIGFGLALGIGVVTLRFRGAFFGVATLVMVLAAFNLIQVIPGLGGGEGLPLNIGFQPLGQFYTIWVILAAEMGLTLWISRGRIGHGIRAIKSDEDAAKAVGVDAPRIKLFLYGFSGLFAGASGAVFAWQSSGAFPTQNFNLAFSLQMLAMIVIGGMGTLVGPLLGALVVQLPSDYFQTVAVGTQLIFIGVLVAIFALFLPGGIVGALRKYVPEIGRYLE
jgi:branched-chain amino acid transport system permease protein